VSGLYTGVVACRGGGCVGFGGFSAVCVWGGGAGNLVSFVLQLIFFACCVLIPLKFI